MRLVHALKMQPYEALIISREKKVPVSITCLQKSLILTAMRISHHKTTC